MHALRIINKDGQAPTAEEITAANKVATTFKAATIGTFKVTDPVDDIEVEYHAHKALAFTLGGSSIYFGFDAAVEMRCKCKEVEIHQYLYTPKLELASLGFDPATGRRNFTFTIKDHFNATKSVTAGYIRETGSGTTLVTEYSNAPYSGMSGFVEPLRNVKLDWQVFNGVHTSMGNSGEWVELSPSYGSLIDSNSIVVAIDSVKFYSVKSSESYDVYPAPDNGVASDVTYSNYLPNTDYAIGSIASASYTWNGLNTLEYGVITNIYNEVTFSIDTRYSPTGHIDIDVPDDACHSFVDTNLPFFHVNHNLTANLDYKDAASSIVRVTIPPVYPAFLPTYVNINGTKVTESIGEGKTKVTYTDYPWTANIFELANGVEITNADGITEQVPSGTQLYRHPDIVEYVDSSVLAWLDTCDAGRVVATARENKRRLKCSMAQHELLRNGFLPPEFDYFIKNNAPKSEKLRRKIPMQIVSNTSDIVSEVTNPDGGITQVYESTVKIKYITTSDDGSITEHEREFNGTATYVETIHKVSGDAEELSFSTSEVTLVDYPILTGDSSGKAYPMVDVTYPYDSINDVKNSIWHDDADAPLFVIGNGIYDNGKDFENGDATRPPYYPYGTNVVEPPVQSFSNNITFTHPQFLLDYIKDSQPIEYTSGNEEVTPNTDWLSSRISDGEEFKVVPLNHVQGIKIIDVINTQSDALSYIELEVRGQVVETIPGTKSVDSNGNTVYSRYHDRNGSGRWGELKTTGQDKIETIISSREYQNVLSNIRDGVFDVNLADYDSVDDAVDAMVTGNKGMFPLRTHSNKNEPEIDHAIAYGYAVVKFDASNMTFTVQKWVEFTEAGKIDIFPDDDVTLNDELDPTEITVTSKDEDNKSVTKTYKLAPRVTTWSTQWGSENCVCVSNKTLWSDIKAEAKTQKDKIKNDPLSSPSALLYRAVSEMIKG